MHAGPSPVSARPEKKGKSAKILVEYVKEGLVNFIAGNKKNPTHLVYSGIYRYPFKGNVL